MVKFYRCKQSGSIVTKLIDNGENNSCCGGIMEEIIPASVEASREKHIPEYELNGNEVKITIGAVIHPMTEPHYIELIILETNKGFYTRKLCPSNEPNAVFALKEEKPIAAYAYCNLHGLWQKTID